MLAGTEFAHALAYRLVYPQAAVRWQVLAATGHGYMQWLPLALAVAGSVSVIGLGTEAVGVARRRPSRRVPAWAFALLPLLAFTVQEFLERWVMVGGLPWWMVEQPTFRVGLLLQLPFAAVTFVVARLVLRAAERIGLALELLFPRLAPCPPGAVAYASTAVVAAGSVLSRRHAGRAPPMGLRALLPCA
jgi:hypothetical protein